MLYIVIILVAIILIPSILALVVTKAAKKSTDNA
jgi:hypothetical protein